MAGPESYNQFDQGDRGISQAPEQRFEAPELNNHALLTGIQTENAKWPTFERAYEATGALGRAQVSDDGSIVLAGWRPNNGAVELSFDQALKIAVDRNGNGHHALLTDVVTLNPLEIRPEDLRGNPDWSSNIHNNPEALAWRPGRLEPVDMRDDMRPAGSEIIDAARHLGENFPEKWQDAPDGPGKCNLYLDATLRASGIRPPWPEDKVPTVHQMRAAFKNHPEDWELVYSHGQDGKFDRFQSLPGDVAIWDKTVTPPANDRYYDRSYHLEHCGIIDEDRTLHYAGSRDTHGYRAFPIQGFIDSAHYQAPTEVYRYKHLRK